MISRKVLAQGFASFVLATVVAILARQGIHLSPASTGELAGFAGWFGGLAAGWLAKEEPALVGDSRAPEAPPAPPKATPAPQAGTVVTGLQGDPAASQGNA